MDLEQYIQANYSLSSYKNILNRIKHYQNHTPNHQQSKLKDILNYLKIHRDLKKNPRTIDLILHSIKVYYNYLQETKLRKDHPCKDLQLKDKIDKTIQTQNLHTQEALERYYQNTPKHKKLMVSLLVYQALITSELTGLKVANIDLETAQIQLPNRTLPLQAHQIYMILAHIKTKETNDYLFTTQSGRTYPNNEITGYINQSRKKQDRITPQKIRQSVIKNLLNTHDIRVVQVFAGHKKSATTQQYKTTDFEELQIKISELHPLK